MKLYLAAFVIFLLAFTGLAAGLLLRRKGLRGGCSPSPESSRDCQCKSLNGSGVKKKTGQDLPGRAN